MTRSFYPLSLSVHVLIISMQCRNDSTIFQLSTHTKSLCLWQLAKSVSLSCTAIFQMHLCDNSRHSDGCFLNEKFRLNLKNKKYTVNLSCFCRTFKSYSASSYRVIHILCDLRESRIRAHITKHKS